MVLAGAFEAVEAGALPAVEAGFGGIVEVGKSEGRATSKVCMRGRESEDSGGATATFAYLYQTPTR